MDTVCVLTGDLIDSQGGQTALYLEAINSILEELKNKQKILRSDLYRGDEFQITTLPEEGLLCALYIRASLRAQNAKWDAKISIAFGEEKESDGAYGAAYLHSGRNLDSLSANTRMQIMVEEQKFSVLAQTMDYIISGWSQTTARAVRARLYAKTAKEAAEQLQISPANVSRALKRGGYEVLLGLAKFIYEAGGLDEHSQS
ncbi:hypothetical protein [Halodesulfovibrio marinisediminis]|uniref:SatD family (SatD) n=1 Tax=Halodesulfovibrio marinisediminis DSM 17456 TaxID=1121457 RepID=A0A1N6DP84_9BACT|nr:hypothetical protein [Halodesulfovibrio marinisediminis]SIN72527.1 hypothetical protein SAMN02745161_0358 [Halodesulfovibrio marinisediminis DSM 17456]